jgi:hypothetical protein
MPPRRLIALAAALFASLAAPSAAVATTIQVTGVVSSITNTTSTLVLDGSVVVGTVFTETYTYGPNLVDDHPADPTYGGYSPISGYSLTVGNYTLFDPNPGGFIVVQNDFFGRDAYFADKNTTGQLIGSLGGTPDSSFIQLVTLSDNSHSAFDSDALQVPNPADFLDQNFARIGFFEGAGEGVGLLNIVFTIRDIEQVPEPVPEPATLTLLALPTALLLYRRKTPRRHPFVER